MKKLKFVNYKAFNEGELEICPLTLLLGANSSGKSSILHLLLMLEQTINNAEAYHAAFKTNGHSINMGEDENLLKDKNHALPMELEFGINVQEYISSVTQLLEKKNAEIFVSYSFAKEKKPEANTRNSDYSFISSFQNEESEFYRFLRNHLAHRNEEDFLYQTFLSSEFVFNPNLLHVRSEDADALKKKFDALHNCLDAFKRICRPYPSDVSIKYVLTYNETTKKLTVSECYVIVGEKELVRITNKGNKSLLYSDIFDADDLAILASDSTSFFDFEGMIISSKNNNPTILDNIILMLVQQAMKPIILFLGKHNLNYVGPLRANPQRYYFLDDSNTNTTLDHRYGASLAEILKKNRKIQGKVNKWMEKFDLNVDVAEFKDVIHNIKVTQNGLMLDIPDVGFGISQLLPILVEGLMSPPKSTIIMEQPEIHLHPRMQAELADLFIDILNLKTKTKKKINKHLIIETHSEYILKRIRRRMAEGDISPKQIAIYFVKPRNKDNPDSAVIERAQISRDGTIEWPEDFYITELEDEMAFLKAKIKKS